MIPKGRITIPDNDEISFERCTIHDLEFVTYVMDTDNARNWFAEDGDEDLDFRPFLEDSGVYIIKILLYGNPIGLVMVAPMGRVLIEIQIAILPPYRGRYSVDAARAGMWWLFNNTECQKIVVFIPKNNRKSYAMAKKVGMRIIGVIQKSYLKNGKLQDQYIMGITKEVFSRG